MPATSDIIKICSVLFLTLLVYCHCLPTQMIQSKLFDLDFARPEDGGDLQRNSARLHRTLFLLDTSDLLKKARLFTSGGDSDNENDPSSPMSSLSRSVKQLFRLRREAKPPSSESAAGEPTKYINIIKVRKPFLTIDEESSYPVESTR